MTTGSIRGEKLSFLPVIILLSSPGLENIAQIKKIIKTTFYTATVIKLITKAIYIKRNMAPS